MPDVPERCPECGSDLSQKFELGYHRAWYKCKSVLFCTGGFRQSLACLQNQRDNLRAEAERWKQQYEALMAEMESVAQDLRKRAYSCAKDWLETGHHYHDGASDAYYMAEEMVSRLIERRRLEQEIERLRQEREAALDKGGDRGWPTRESERARLAAEVGECCRGADPLCAAGCLVEAALRQRLVDKVRGEA